MNISSLSGQSDAESHIQPENHGSEDASPLSELPADPESEETDSTAVWPIIAEEDDIDFRFGTQMGDAEMGNRTPADVAPHRVYGRPKAAAKLLVRSGLRCYKCHLKAWVCLCDRAPVELDRRGTAPNPSERYMFICLRGLPAVVSSHILVDDVWHAAHSGPTRALHYRLWAAIPVLSIRQYHVPLCSRQILASILVQRPITEHCFKRYSYNAFHPNPRWLHLQPTRGPKSAPEPYFIRLKSLAANRLRGLFPRGVRGCAEHSLGFSKGQGSMRKASIIN